MADHLQALCICPGCNVYGEDILGSLARMKFGQRSPGIGNAYFTGQMALLADTIAYGAAQSGRIQNRSGHGSFQVRFRRAMTSVAGDGQSVKRRRFKRIQRIGRRARTV